MPTWIEPSVQSVIDLLRERAESAEASVVSLTEALREIEAHADSIVAGGPTHGGAWGIGNIARAALASSEGEG